MSSSNLAGKRYSEIKDTVWGRRLHTTQIVVNVIDPQTPAKVKFDIFKRINTLGEPLSAQEIRHCMSRSTSRQFLKGCADSPEFVAATGGSLRNHKRMADREAVLRFCAFRMLGNVDAYDAESIDVFLTDATEKIDMSTAELRERLAAELKLAARNATALFGDRAFRKWPEGVDTRVNPINKPLLEASMVALADFQWEDLEPRKEAIVAAARKAMTDDYPFQDAISTGTGDPRKVKLRFRLVRAIVERAGTTEPVPQSTTLVQPPSAGS